MPGADRSSQVYLSCHGWPCMLWKKQSMLLVYPALTTPARLHCLGMQLNFSSFQSIASKITCLSFCSPLLGTQTLVRSGQTCRGEAPCGGTHCQASQGLLLWRWCRQQASLACMLLFQIDLEQRYVHFLCIRCICSRVNMPDSLQTIMGHWKAIQQRL